MKKRVFVTGGSGFIGTNLISHLLNKGYEVCSFDIEIPRNIEHKKYWVQGELLDGSSLLDSTRQFGPDYFVHLGARTDLEGKVSSDYLENIDGVQNVIEVLRSVGGIERVLFASSRLVCRIGYSPTSDQDYCPTTAYGESKVIGEQIVRQNADRIPCPWLIVRPTSIWGPWFGAPYKDFFVSILRGRYVHPRGVKIRKSFGYVGNTVYMLEKLASCDSTLVDKKTLYLSDYPPIDVKTWADQISTMAGKRKIVEVPTQLLALAAWVGDMAKLAGIESPPLTSFRLDNLLTNMVYDTKDLESICGILPYSQEEGVQDTLNWLSNDIQN